MRNDDGSTRKTLRPQLLHSLLHVGGAVVNCGMQMLKVVWLRSVGKMWKLPYASDQLLLFPRRHNGVVGNLCIFPHAS